MDFLANLVKRPISITLNEASPSNQVSPAESPSDGISLSSQQLGSDAPSPLIASAMNTSINTEMTDLLESAKEDLLRIEGRKNSKSPSKEVLEETTILKNDTTSIALNELMEQINENLKQVSDEDVDDVVQDIDPLNLHETQTHLECYQELSPMTTKSKQQQPQSAELRASIQGELTLEDKIADAFGANRKRLDANAGGDANIETVPKKFTGLTEYDESKIPELDFGSTTVSDAQLKEDLQHSYSGVTTNPMSSTAIMPDKHLVSLIDSENECNSDSDFFAECQSVNSDKCTTDPTLELDAYRSALNFHVEDVKVNEHNSINATLDNAPFIGVEAVHQNVPFGDGNETQQSLHNVMHYEDEPMDVSMNSTLGLQKEINEAVSAPAVEPVALVSENQIILLAQNIPNVDATVNILPNEITLPEEEPSLETAVDTFVASEDETKIEKKPTESMNEIQSAESTLTDAGNIEILSLKDLRYQGMIEDANKSNLTLDMTGSFGSIKATSTRLPSPNLQAIPDKISTGSSTDARVNLTLDMTSSFDSNKSHGPASPLFPIKQTKSPQAFPFSPRAPPEKKEMTFLEIYDSTPLTSKSIDINVTMKNPQESEEITASQVINETICLSTEPADSVLNGTFDKGVLTRCDTEKRRTFCIAPTLEEEQAIDGSFPDSDKNSTQTFAFPTSKSPPSNSSSRRTFSITDTERSFTIDNETEVVKNLRRTFNLPSREESIECDEPMDVDQTLPLDDQKLVMSPPIPTHRIKSAEQEIVVLTESDHSKSSPPLPILQNQAVMGHTQIEQPYSPPLASIRSTFNVPEQPPNTVATSPPIPTLQNSLNERQKHIIRTIAASYPEANPQYANLKRPSIHKTPVEDHKLSEKELAKSNSKDEKDVFVENIGSESSASIDIFATPQSTSTFAKLKSAAKQNDTEDDQDQFFDVDDKQHPNIFFNPSDFEYLLTKGNNSNVQVDRSSLLLKFDPLLGVPVPSNQASTAGAQQQQQQLQQIQDQQQLLQVFGISNRYRSLSPTIEESEKSFSGLDQDQDQPQEQQRRLDTSSLLAPLEGLQRAKTGDTYILKPAVDRLKKHAKMSVDVIDNDCNKTFENSNSQSEEKQLTYNKMDELEKKLKNEVLKSSEDFEKKLKDAEQREEALIKRITDKDKTITKMTGVIEAYEKAIAELINEKEQIISNFERQLSETKADRDSNYHHLTSLETTFSDLHVKYEKSKEMTQQLKNTEESLMNEKKQILDNLRLQEQRYEKMRNHAMQQLEIANKKLESIMKENAIEVTKLRASLKKEEVSRSSIQEQLQQKTIENAELVKICDELINGQGS